MDWHDSIVNVYKEAWSSPSLWSSYTCFIYPIAVSLFLIGGGGGADRLKLLRETYSVIHLVEEGRLVSKLYTILSAESWYN